MDMETLAGAYRILAGAKIYAEEYAGALDRGNTKRARRALRDLESKTMAFKDNLAVFDNAAVAAEVQRVHTALVKSNLASDDLLDHLERGKPLRTPEGTRLARRWLQAITEVNRVLRGLPARLRPHLSSDQRKQFERGAG